MDWTELVLRLGIAAVGGAALGLERQIGGHHAGFRTHTLVALGACLFTLAGAYGFTDLHPGPTIDPARIAAQVVSGIGFLGAGAILRDGASVRGLTTAATLWISAALGLAAAAGAYTAAAATAVLVLAVLSVLRTVRALARRISGSRDTLTIEYQRGHGTLGPLIRALDEAQARVRTIQIHDTGLDDPDPVAGIRRVEIRLHARHQPSLATIVDVIGQRPEVLTVQVQPD
ncbi:MgtC/SapB family protein [Phytohabitans sp. ZYX-F-186]|uniref:MgtC/SapB family protein n=1 Tax=Phytohabitans maris TaxID=3071409 RepID=A0ABU0ZNZ7_9ACTN|nr:MgtC/SapB family protein [Phytohabitans sp. ZYX-F-186]MDQ7908761.1 MgtC/SapB family protein [Phytohabitans sp. ZYX-F-186]